MGRLTINESDVDHAIALRQSGLSYREIAERINRSEDAIRVKCVQKIGGGRIYIRACNARDYPREEARDRYLLGESIKSLSVEYGIQRATLTNDLRRSGVPLRDRSAAMFVRMSRTSEEERKRLTDAAHHAVRGCPHSESKRLRRAEVRGRRVGIGERELTDLFAERGHRVDPQAPVGFYNVDMLVDGSVAVELHSNAANPLRRTEQRQRLEYILDRGIRVLFIRFHDVASLDANIEHIIADVDALRRYPSTARQYRVVRCHYEIAPFARHKANNTFLPGPRTTKRPEYGTVDPVNDRVPR